MPPLGVMTAEKNAQKKVVCYYTNWSQYRPGNGKFVPENVDPFLCTHIIYAFAKLNDDSLLEAFEWNDLSTEWMVGMYDRMIALKKKNKNLKILLAAGGMFILNEIIKIKLKEYIFTSSQKKNICSYIKKKTKNVL